MSTSKPSSSIPDGVTKSQRAMLDALDNLGWWDASRLLTQLYEYHRTAQGVHQTAASLVRRGLVKKQTVGKLVTYHISSDGAQLLAALRYTEAARNG